MDQQSFFILKIMSNNVGKQIIIEKRDMSFRVISITIVHKKDY
jgi:hypothetical protein